MVDWDALVIGPVMTVFGQAVDYTPDGGITVRLTDAVFDDGFYPVDPIGQPGVMSTQPRLGVRIASMPAGWDAINAEGDIFTVVATGKTYRVREGQPDSHGHARLDANEVTA